MFGSDRQQMRRTFVEAWRKAREGLPMEPVEAQIAEVIREHPEYHDFFSDPAIVLEREFTPEDGQSNPFLHLGMHLGIREQVATDRPAGIADIHRRLSERKGDHVEAEHLMMECLGRVMWEAQRAGRAPDEQDYLECLRKLG